MSSQPGQSKNLIGRALVTSFTLLLTVAFVLFDNQLERVAYLYTERSLLIRAALVFPVLSATLGYLFWAQKKSVQRFRKMRSETLDAESSVMKQITLLLLCSAGMAWMSVNICVALADSTAKGQRVRSYVVSETICLREMCDLYLNDQDNLSVVRLPISRQEFLSKSIKAGSKVNLITRESIFGDIADELSVYGEHH